MSGTAFQVPKGLAHIVVIRAISCCWGTRVTFYIKSISNKERNVGAAIGYWVFYVHGMNVLTTFWLNSSWLISWSHFRCVICCSLWEIRLCAWDKTWKSSRFGTTFLLFPVSEEFAVAVNPFSSSYCLLFPFVNCFDLDGFLFPERRSCFSVFFFQEVFGLAVKIIF